MRISHTIVAASLTALTATLAFEQSAAAQPVPNPAPRDQGWGTVSDVALTIGVLSPFVMPRVFYSDPTATVGWKGRWHFSVIAPAMTMAAATLLVDLPIKKEAKGARPGCSFNSTNEAFPGAGCETFGGPSTHLFATWGALGTGTTIFLVDTFKYSDGRFSVPSFIGNIAIPLTASVFGTIGRAIQSGPQPAQPGGAGVFPFEDGGQIAAGAISGLLTGAAIGVTYALLQKPSCGYGDALFCW
jgi:hypothetical protein